MPDRHTARARRTDPATSHEAAAHAETRRVTLRTNVYDTLTRNRHPFTLADAVTHYRLRATRGEVPHASDSGIRTRISELMRDGLITPTGETVKINGRRHRLLEITPTDDTPPPLLNGDPR